MSVSADAEWMLLAGERRRDLARQLVRMDALADRFEAQGLYDRADEVRWDRDGVREERSRLMREIWRARHVVVPR